MGSLLAALATIIVGGLAALFALPYFVDWNDYKLQFETQAAKLVGRPVAIEGDIDLSILPVPRLSLRGLRISDEFGRFDRPFAEVEEFKAVLSLPPLLRGTMEAEEVALDQPIIRLKIDDFGEGTWLSIGPHGMAVPVPVRQVVLNNVDIRDGAIELRRPDAPPTRFDRISGRLSADSLSGPFRFAGVGAIGGDDKDIQVAAVKPKDSPHLRLKGALRSIDGVSLYQLDGQIKGLNGPVHYEGPVAARLALDAVAKTSEAEQIAEPIAGKAIELRASAKITLEEAKLDDITLTVTHNDRPQSVTGWAHASWSDTPRLDLSLEASWLDIDQMLGSVAGGERPVPTMAIAALPRIFEGWSFKPRQGKIDAKIRQAGLSGDVLENVDFSASHGADGWKIDTFVARLPGETDIDVKGTLPAGDALAFNGSFVLKGKNLSRLMRWSAPSLGVVDTGNVENFSLSSGVVLTPEQLAFRNAKGALGSSSFTGDLIHDYGKNSKLLLALESERLDLRTLYGREDEAPEAEKIENIEPYKTTNDWSAQTVSTRKTRLIDVLGTVFKADQSNVSLLVSELQLPDFEARNVRSAFRYEKGTFDFRELNVATSDGLIVKANGRITGFDTQPNGSLKLSIDAPSAQSVTNLTRLVGLSSVSRGAKRRIEALSPFQLRGQFDAAAAQQSMRLTLAGVAGGSELTFNGRMRGSIEDLGKASVNIDGGIGNQNGSRLIAQLAPEVPLSEAAKQKGAGFLKVTALGTMAAGLASRIELQTPQARGQFEGQLALLAEPSWQMSGQLNMRARQAATALSMLRLTPGGTPVTGAIDLQAAITKQAAIYQVSDLTLNIAGETIRGSLKADVSGNRSVANVDIRAASVSIPKVAAYLVDWDRDDLQTQIANIAGVLGGAWPEQPFALTSLKAVDGTLTIKAPRIHLTDDLVLSKARLDASLKEGTLTLKALKGGIYGGDFLASGNLTALKGRAGLDAKIKLANADLARLSRAHGDRKIASGRADLNLSMKGEGISPRGLVTVLSGDGDLTFNKGTIVGLSPSVMERAAKAYLSEEIPNKDALRTLLNKDLRSGNLAYNTITTPLTLRDGILRAGRVNFGDRDYSAKADLVVNLNSLMLDSDWALASLAKVGGGKSLPPIRMVFKGPLVRFSDASATVDASSFERRLSILRMDADMDRLEELNRQRGLPPTTIARPDTPEADRAEASGQDRPPLRQDITATTGRNDEDLAPSQSLLRAIDEPSNQVKPVDPAAQAPAPQPPVEPQRPEPTVANKNADTNWATGVETNIEPSASADKTGDTGWQPDPLSTDSEPNSGDFEAQIREVLRAQENSRQPAYQ